MNTVELRGILVDASYDNWAWADEIASGFITPESRARKQIMTASGDLNIIISSYGGSVFAGNSIAAAMATWRTANPGSKLAITIEAIALSAAANLLLQAPKGTRIRAHKNSLLMYHGAQTWTIGGEGAHQDAEQLMAQINTGIKDALVAKGFESQQVAGWFSEGRMGWMSAQEAQQHGIIDEIIDADAAPAAKVSAEQAQKIHNRSGIDLAAFAAKPGCSLMDVIKATAEANAEDTDTAETTPDDTPANTETTEEGQQEESNTEQTTEDAGEDAETASEQAETSEESAQQDAATQQALADAQARATAAEARVADLEKKLSALSADHGKLRAQLGKLTAGLAGPGATAVGPSSYAEAVAAIQREYPRWQRDDCVIAARNQYPELYQAIRSQQ